MLHILKSKWLDRIEADEVLQIKIGNAFDPPKKISTIKRWIKENNVMLTNLAVLNIIRQHEGLSKNEELTEVAKPQRA